MNVRFKHEQSLYRHRSHFNMGTPYINTVALPPVIRVVRLVEMPQRQCGKSPVSTVEAEN